MGNFEDLPADIILEILTRLPTQSVLDSKLVSRPWRYLVSHHPSFSRMHLTHLNHSPESGELSFLVISYNRKQLCYFEYIDKTAIHSFRRVNFTIPFAVSGYKVVGSVNGLVCLFGWQDKTSCSYCICNLVTREYVMLPRIKTDFDDQYIHRSSGFGYLPLTNEYKIVEFYKFRVETDSMEVVVYTLGSGKGWRNVARLDSKFYNVRAEHGVFVRGTLHWRIRRGTVVAFDLTEEKITEHISPPPLPDSSMYYSLTELGGVLYYAIKYHFSRGSGFGIWSSLKQKNDNLEMKEQVENQPLGWKKEFNHLERVPVAITKSGGVLGFDGSSFGIYDPIASTSRKLVFVGALSRTISHKNTLISLKELGEEDIKIMEPADLTT